jgi:hypothetical protein
MEKFAWTIKKIIVLEHMRKIFKSPPTWGVRFLLQRYAEKKTDGTAKGISEEFS